MEAQRRLHSLVTSFFRRDPRVKEWICSVERQQRGAIHYHCVFAFSVDIREGFDFENARKASQAHKAWNLTDDWTEKARLQALKRQYEALYFQSANPALRGWWRDLREAAKAYGFGRCETLPILSNSQALARYVGSYVGTELENRQACDKGMKTIRYALSKEAINVGTAENPKWLPGRAASCRWSWAFGNGHNWRKGCTVLAAILQTEDFTGVLGDKWGYNWGKEIAAFGRHCELCLQAVHERLSDEKDMAQRVAAATKLYEAIAAHEAAQAARQSIPQ